VQEDIGKKSTQERVNDLTRKSTEYQKLINELSGEIQRLNEILKAKLQETTVL
jgi:peptidoglycan hydrolase CwlO-like protein